MNGLDLFSGIGGLTLALKEWVSPIAYCEIEPYCQGVLASRMSEGRLPVAPIWDDVRTLESSVLPARPEIIYGGFPCQDLSVAGVGKGLEGERSGLFFEIVRLAEEIKPTFLFLENVPGIRTKGLCRVIEELSNIGYDCRWHTLSATEIGANHKRNRWWLLAHSRCEQERASENLRSEGKKSVGQDTTDICKEFSDSRNRETAKRVKWWKTEPAVDRVVNVLPFRVDRIKSIGNAVVPLQARKAFKELIGLY